MRPDLLLIDINAWGARIQAESSGLPWATFSPYTPPLQSKGTPPFGPGLAPMSGPWGRAPDAVARRLVIGAVEKLMLPRINSLRAAGQGAKRAGWPTATLPRVEQQQAWMRWRGCSS